MFGNRINIVVNDGKKMIKYGQKIEINEDFNGVFSLTQSKINVQCQFVKKSSQSWMKVFRQSKIPNCEITFLPNCEIYIAYVYQLTNAQLANKALSSPIIVSGENHYLKYDISFSFNPGDIYETLNYINRLQKRSGKVDKRGHYENHYIVTNPKPYQGGSFSGK